MVKSIRTFFISLMLILSFSITTFGFGTGLSSVESNSKKQTWTYYTGIVNEYGYSDYLKNEWKEINNNWFYFGEDGLSICNKWEKINDNWYHFDNQSVMQHDTTIDGHTVGSDGAWIPADGETAPVQETAAGN